MTRIPATLLMVCLALFGQAATYYVSHNGNDQNSGTSPSQPWRTIDRVQQVSYSLQPGDQILFERGGVYPGMLIVPRSGNSAQPIVVGAYGSGDRPVISGGEPVINWVIRPAYFRPTRACPAINFFRVSKSSMYQLSFPDRRLLMG